MEFSYFSEDCTFSGKVKGNSQVQTHIYVYYEYLYICTGKHEKVMEYGSNTAHLLMSILIYIKVSDNGVIFSPIFRFSPIFN